MKPYSLHKLIPALVFLAGPAISACAQDMVEASALASPNKLTLSTSIATRHFHPDPAHNNTQHLLHLEWNYRDDMVAGVATFKNSYRQQTQLLYWGRKFRPIDAAPDFYVKVVGGLLHGYKGEYQDNIPFNKYGTAPVILPFAGYCYKRVCSELIVFGIAGAMLTGGVQF